ncbi:cytochrome c oxidase accessory protein CcoG [Brucella endophytica]|uniref:Cytochrome c oxidase accessory protein CcoG n=1 Tax=Brucella endophytica TaxID=1963359 RepID=A0A916WJ23_9HYPH|nr:cytochrome c oxidase accessory protein CcoG [Brucella endophytica]
MTVNVREVLKSRNKVAEPAASGQSLYAARKKIYPKRASGTFRQIKWLVMAITLCIYYLAPWIRWDRGPYAPDQAMLVDLANRRFYFFFIEIWPQEFVLIAGLLVMAGAGLFLITSVAGRAWCGYACPQTVWVDLFLVVERAVEGDRNARMKLDQAPWTSGKIGKKLVKHLIWIVIGVATGGAWIFYFADAPTLARDFVLGQASPVAYFTVAILTSTTYILGGFMREQVCNYMCPWPRIQAAMLDEDSLTVTYNAWRGEPRSRGTKKSAAAGILAGDCVDCDACVVVCPQGIDIRNGQQMECITCALCIDACNNVMDKLGKERGLISYATLVDYQHNMDLATANGTTPIAPALVRTPQGKLTEKLRHFRLGHILRPRTIIYFSVWMLVGVGILTALVGRTRLELSVLHDRNPQFVTLSDGSIRNGYTVKILNMVPQPRAFTISIAGLPDAVMSAPDAAKAADGTLDVEAAPDRVHTFRVFVAAPAGSLKEEMTPFEFHVAEKGGTESAAYKAIFNAPEKR